MEQLFAFPYILRILISLLLILLINHFTKRLTVAVTAGTLVLASWLGHPAENIAVIALHRLISEETGFLAVIVFQIISLSSQMSETGIMKELVEYVRSRVSQRASMAVLPAIVGILPMPGGAIFSAPMVDDCDHDGTIGPQLKANVNYWFRHIWEFWWPFYPGVILLMDITGLPASRVFMSHAPLTLATITAGYFILLRKIEPADSPMREKWTPAVAVNYLKLVYPFIIVILVYAITENLFPSVRKINKYLPLVSGILLAQIVIQLKRPLGSTIWRGIVLSKKTFALIGLVCLIRIYGAFIESALPDGCMVMDKLRFELDSWGIPYFMLLVLIPFISGVTTGIALGFVGASFPIVMSIIGADPEPGVLYSSVILSYCSGYLGMMLSPVHVCLVVTNEYFSSNIAKNLMVLLKPSLMLFSTACALYLLYGNIL